MVAATAARDWHRDALQAGSECLAGLAELLLWAAEQDDKEAARKTVRDRLKGLGE